MQRLPPIKAFFFLFFPKEKSYYFIAMARYQAILEL